MTGSDHLRMLPARYSDGFMQVSVFKRRPAGSRLPRLAARAGEQAICLVIADEDFLRRVPAQAAFELEGRWPPGARARRSDGRFPRAHSAARDERMHSNQFA